MIHIIPVEDEEMQFTNIHHQNNMINKLSNKVYKSQQPHIIENTNEYQLQNSRLQQIDDASITSTSASQQSLNNLAEDDDFHSSWAEDDDFVDIPQTEIEQIISAVDQQTSKLQRELLSHHYRLKHLPFPDLQRLAKKGVIPKNLEKIKIPLCYSCMMGKQTKRPWRGKGKKNLKHIRRPEECFAGANTSTDHMISPFGGLIPQLKGRLMRAKYYAATIFVDHHTDYTYVHLMRDSTAESTLEAKNAYEHLLLTFGHKVHAYHADNGRFAESVFVQDVKDKAQNITYCGVGSHHQNGIAERRIRSLGEDARTMLAHGQHLWPEVVTKSLWAFAYKAACRSRNKFKLDDQGLSPEEKLSGIRAQQDIRNEHPLFCPIFTPDSGLQSGMGGIPKWNPRSNAGVYLGHSPDHASNVAMVLSLTTGLVSPQYHVIFDDDFSTVDFIRSKKEPSNWENLCKFHAENYSMSDMPDHKTLADIQESVTNTSKSLAPIQQLTQPPENSEGDAASSHKEAPQNNDFSMADPEPESVSNNLPPAQPPPVEAPQTIEGDSSPNSSMSHDHPDAPLRRSSRNKKPIERLTSSKLGDLMNSSLTSALTVITSYFTSNELKIEYCYTQFKQRIQHQIITHQAKLMHYDQAVELNVDGSINNTHPFSFATTTANNEAYHFHQAMQEDDREEFIGAMIKELNDHTVNNHWKLVLRKEIGDTPTIKAIWSFKRKKDQMDHYSNTKLDCVRMAECKYMESITGTHMLQLLTGLAYA